MGNHTYEPFSSGWMLRHMPVVSFFAQDDSGLTLRFLEGPDGRVFGREASDVKGNLGLLSERVMPSDDQSVFVDQIGECVKGRMPVISRVHIFDASRRAVPILLATQGVFDRSGRFFGLAGVAIDISGIPTIQGKAGLLSRTRRRRYVPVTADRVDDPTADWVAKQLPGVCYSNEDDASYTVRSLVGPLHEMIGYNPEDLIDNARYKAWSVIPPEDEHVVERHVNASFSRGEKMTLSRYRAVNVHGVDQRLLVAARCVPHPEREGRILCSFAMNIDEAPALAGESDVLNDD